MSDLGGLLGPEDADKKRQRSSVDLEPGEEAIVPKRARNTSPPPTSRPASTNTRAPAPPAVSKLGLTPQLPELPPSLLLATGEESNLAARRGFVAETDVGIVGYLGSASFPGVHGVIKQRFTDFLVNEILPTGEVLHLKDIGKPRDIQDGNKLPQPSTSGEVTIPSVPETEVNETKVQTIASEATTETVPAASLGLASHPQWPTTATSALREHFSDETVVALHSLLVGGKEAKPQQDAGWGSRDARKSQLENEEELAMNGVTAPSQGRDVGRGRNQRGGGRGGRAGNAWQPEDSREVVSQPIVDKDARAAAHQVIRDVFNGKLESTSRDIPNLGQSLVIKWARVSGRQQRQDRGQNRGPKLPPYIHFTLHKTNRETMDCLGHIGRLLKVPSKDLTVCGTKDKRAVTVQRVCLRRGGHTLESVWKAVNGIKGGYKSETAALQERGDRGTRIGDLQYSTELLDLGKLKGNRFVITLRNLQIDDTEEIDKAMSSIRDNGFINFYGMQRFGTSSVPTHVTGLLLLQGKWGEAIDSILSLREGEHPDCARARLAWLEDKDLEKALELMPRRSVAERSIWEHWRRGNRFEDKLGAITTIPRNLRSMYVHAYQSYIWNLVVAKRVQLSSTAPLVGDLVYADGDDDGKEDSTVTRDVIELTAENVGDYSIGDIVMPLPGWNVDYPGGEISELYRDLLAADGLDYQRMRRDQREYSLPGAYRKVVHKPTDVEWDHVRYTDPDLALAQSDEDRILELNHPALDDPEGKFRALKIGWSLGTASYATMALREITRQETSTWHQIGLTEAGEDQAHKNTGGSAQ